MMGAMSTRVKIIAAVVGVLALLAASPFVYQYVTKYLQVSLGAGDDPYDYVTIVHRNLPESTVPDEWADRLEKQVGAELGLTVRQDWRPEQGDGAYAEAMGFRELLADQLTLADDQGYRVMGVLTNALDQAAVREFGTVYLIWFQTTADNERWLKTDPAIFRDNAAELRRLTWWAGFDAVYYAPPSGGDGTDISEQVDTWVRSVTACPNSERGCTVPDHIRTAGVDQD